MTKVRLVSILHLIGSIGGVYCSNEPITERSNVKSKQLRITFDTQLKIALNNTMKCELEPTTVPRRHKQTVNTRVNAILTHVIGAKRGKTRLTEMELVLEFDFVGQVA